MEYKRILQLIDSQTESLFLWGARQVGKSTLLKNLFPSTKIYDLLKSDEYARLVRKPQLLREELALIYSEEELLLTLYSHSSVRKSMTLTC